MMEANIQEYGGNSVVVKSDNIAALTPNVENINVNKSTKVHIGPKFVSVTQNVNNIEVVRGRFLGLRLVSTKHPGRLSCSVAVFICWSIVVASALIVYIVHVALPKPTKMDLDLKADWYFRREEWQAMQAYSVEFYQLPLQYVIIGHAATDHCDERFACTRIMLMIQEDHLRRNLGDIGPNFLVGGNGLVFEGRGANVVPAMVRSWNRKSMTIMFIGNYVNDKPDQLQFDHVNVVLQTLVRQGVLRSDYILYGQCQVQPLTVPPGPEIMHRLDNFEHWDPVNATSYCLSDLKTDWYFRREEWQAMQAYFVEFYQLPLQYVIIGHTATGHCDERFACTMIMLVIQEDHLRRNLGDIGPNFLVGGNGLVFEGRGANVVPAMVRSWNRKSMTIMFIGNYVKDKPDQLQFDHINVVLQTLVRQGVLRSDYILYGKCQVQPLTVTPGPKIMHRLDNFEHWDSVNATSYCLSGRDRG